MRDNTFDQRFIKTLRERLPRDIDYAQEIADLLDLDKIPVYRRMTGATRFTTNELAILASHYDISLDSLLDSSLVRFNKTMYMQYSTARREDHESMYWDSLENYIPQFEKFAQAPNSEFGAAVHYLPRQAYMSFEPLFKFFLFKWGHYYTDDPYFSHYEKIVVPDRLKHIFQRERKMYRNVKHTFYIWDSMIMANVIRDIKYFESMNYISSSNVEILKENLFKLVESFEDTITTGRFQDTGNKFDFYLSSISLEQSHAYMYSYDKHKYCVSIFSYKVLCTDDKDICEDMRAHLHSLKNAAILISGSAEKERVLFLKQLREEINTL